MELLPPIVDALALGAAAALVTLGFVLIVNSTGAANLAHGDLVVLGAVIATGLASWLADWPGITLLPAVAIIMALIGLVFTGITYAPLRGAPTDTLYIGTLCAAVFVATLTGAITGGAELPKIVLLDTASPVVILGAGFSRQSFAIIVAALIIVPAVRLLLSSTQLGRRLRAAAQDPTLATALGIDTVRMTAATLVLAVTIAGVAALFLAERLAAPGAGIGLTLQAYLAAMIAGWGRVGIAAVFAALIAFIEALLARMVGPAIAGGTLYVVLLIFLALRPQGMFGAAAERRA